MYSTVSKNYEMSFDLTDMDFDRCTVGSLKGSSYVSERMRTSLNQLLN